MSDLDIDELISTKLHNGSMNYENLLDYWYIKYNIPVYQIEFIKNIIRGYKMKFYQVQKGETLCMIAEKFNTECKKLIELNNLTNVDFIKEGDILRVK